MKDDPILSFPDPAAWRAWLEEQHEGPTGVWLRIAKKGSGIPSVTYAEALDEALCFGWIDGQKRSHDESTFLQRFSPRGPRSTWSKINVAKVAALEEAGKMRLAGRKAVEAAQADGRWDAAYDGARSIAVPDDLLAGLSPKARKFFEELSGANRYAILFRLQTARKPETRARRLEKIIAMLEAGETFH